MKNKKLDELEEEAKERAQNLLQRANKLRIEQEEELRDMSQVGALPFPLLLPHIGQHWLQLEVGQGRVGGGWGGRGCWGEVAESCICHVVAVIEGSSGFALS